MPQRLKSDVRDRITQAAARAFALSGYSATSVAAIARDAGVSTGNVYRYFSSKSKVFNAVVTPEIVREFDALLTARLASLTALENLPALDAKAVDAQAALLDFWVTQRWVTVILLARGTGTPYADFGARFVDRLVEALFAARPLPETARFVCRQIFEGTRHAIVAILLAHADPDDVRTAFAHFWRYQLAGLAGFATASTEAPVLESPACQSRS